ncbi:hypothetical protein BJ170DRAFT_681942 [Xylariales sp. AK1849]|nr:hypothetical protein BJ170DRAFT_681942 [Xylariales sp. AK1849]
MSRYGNDDVELAVMGRTAAAAASRPTTTSLIPTSTRSTKIMAVENVWYKRVLACLSYRKKLWSIVAAILATAILTSTLASKLATAHSAALGSPSGTSFTTTITMTISGSETTTTATMDTPASYPSTTSIVASATSPSTTNSDVVSSSTQSHASTITSNTPAIVCVRENFKRNASFVGVYDQNVSPPQFSPVRATGEVNCCRECYNLADKSCNGFGWLDGVCWIVYDYPGIDPNATCPRGYPSVRIETAGPESNFAGRGPCAFPNAA